MPETPDTTAREHVVLRRALAATPDQVWRVWTEPEHFAAWYGPAGADVTVHVMDVVVGGDRQVTMRFSTPDGTQEMHLAGVHTVVDRPVRLHYTEAVVPAPGSPPGEPATEVRVTLEESDGGTALELTHLGVPAGSPGEVGWSMALDKLEARLA